MEEDKFKQIPFFRNWVESKQKKKDTYDFFNYSLVGHDNDDMARSCGHNPI